MYEDVVALTHSNGRVHVHVCGRRGEEGRERESMWEERGSMGEER